MRLPFPLLLPLAIAVGAAQVQAEPQAPSFAVRGVEGRVIRSGDFRGRPMVLDFWATWCGPCRASMPHLDAMQTRYRDRGLVIVGLSVDEQPPSEVRDFAQRLGVKFRLGMADEKVLDSFGPIRAIPTTFFINRQGEVVRRVVGYIDAETMDSYVRELLP